MYPSEQDPNSDAGFMAALGSLVAIILLASCGAKNAPQKQPQGQGEKKPIPVEKTTSHPAIQRTIYKSFYVGGR